VAWRLCTRSDEFADRQRQREKDQTKKKGTKTVTADQALAEITPEGARPGRARWMSAALTAGARTRADQKAHLPDLRLKSRQE
jgi:hypothetical protein